MKSPSSNKNGQDKSFWDVCDLPDPKDLAKWEQEDVRAGNEHMEQIWEHSGKKSVQWLVASFRWRLLQCTTEKFAELADIKPLQAAQLEEPQHTGQTVLDEMAPSLSGVVMHWDGLIAAAPDTNGHAYHREILVEGLDRLFREATRHLRYQTQVLFHRERLRYGAAELDESMMLSEVDILRYSRDFLDGGDMVPLNRIKQFPVTGKATWEHPEMRERIDAYVADRISFGMRRAHATLRAVLEFAHVSWDTRGLLSTGLPIGIVKRLLDYESVSTAEMTVLSRVPALSAAGLAEAFALFDRLDSQVRGVTVDLSVLRKKTSEAQKLTKNLPALRRHVAMHEPYSMRDALRILAAESEGGFEGFAQKTGLASADIQQLRNGNASVPFSTIEKAFTALKVPVPALVETEYRLRRAETLSALPGNTDFGRAIDFLIETEWSDDILEKRSKDPAFIDFLRRAHAGEQVSTKEARRYTGIVFAEGGYLASLLQGKDMITAIHGQMQNPQDSTHPQKIEHLKLVLSHCPSRIHLPSADPHELLQRRKQLERWRTGTLELEIQEGIDSRMDACVRSLVELVPGATAPQIIAALAFIPPEKRKLATALADIDDEFHSGPVVVRPQGRFDGKALLPHKPKDKTVKREQKTLAASLVEGALVREFNGKARPAWVENCEAFLSDAVLTIFMEQGIGAGAVSAARRELDMLLRIQRDEQESKEKKKQKKANEEGKVPASKNGILSDADASQAGVEL